MIRRSSRHLCILTARGVFPSTSAISQPAQPSGITWTAQRHIWPRSSQRDIQPRSSLRVKALPQPWAWGLLLAPALAGYLFLRRWNCTRYSLPRETGYHIVFQSAIAGVALFFLARLAVLASAPIPAMAMIERCWKAFLPLDHSGTTALTFVLATILPSILDRFRQFGQLDAQKRAAAAAGDQISLIIDQAMLEGRCWGSETYGTVKSCGARAV